MSDQNGFWERAARFNRIFFRAITISLIIGVGFNIAKAEATPQPLSQKLATEYPDPFKLMRRAQSCYAIDPDADYWGGNDNLTSYQQDWRRVFLAAQFLSVLQGYDLFGAGYQGKTGLVLDYTAMELILLLGADDYDACAAEVKTILPELRDLITSVYAPQIKSTRTRHMEAIINDKAYFGPLRRDEKYWCRAVMTKAVDVLKETPEIFTTHEPYPADALNFHYTEQVSFWETQITKRQYAANSRLDVIAILKDLQNSGLTVGALQIRDATYAFFLASARRCASRRAYIDEKMDAK
ncbi:MAG: hypothetical protein KDA46_10790 [Parvularculaceae bacterium]|nr:hypothetical protein [Parvularculaceae bacterium]